LKIIFFRSLPIESTEVTATGQFTLNLKKYNEGNFIAILIVLLAGLIKICRESREAQIQGM